MNHETAPKKSAPTREQLDAMVEEMYADDVIGDETVAFYREKSRAFKEACARHEALLEEYTRVRAGCPRDDVDREFANEALAAVLAAHRELAIVDQAIHVIVQAAYEASLDTQSK